MQLVSTNYDAETIRFFQTEAQALENTEEITDPMTFHTGTYYARVINKYTSCFTVVPLAFEVTVLDEEETTSGCSPEIPTGFSPNGDGMNDMFTFFTPDEHNCKISVESFVVFDRWGNEVHRSTSFMWNGRNEHNQPLPAGVYIYQLIFSSENDYAGNQHQEYYNSVHLLN